jgi:ribosomal-protein-alanine N-acetyltransferase
MVLFETKRMLVRRFTKADEGYFFLVNGSADVMQYIRPVKNREESDTFLQENLHFYREGSTLGRYAVFSKEEDCFLGTFSFLYLSGEADFHIGYALVPEEWGKGYATELVQYGTRFFFQHTHKEAIFAITESENRASQQVLLKAGYQQKGQLEEHGKTLELFFISREIADQLHIENK